GGDPRLAEYLLLHLGEYARRERAPARGKQQLDPGYPLFHLDRTHQAHVQDGNALLPAAGIIDPGKRVACPRWQLGHTAHRYMAWYRRSRWRPLLPWCREPPDRGQHRSHAR